MKQKTKNTINGILKVGLAPMLVMLLGCLFWQFGGFGYPDFEWEPNFFNILGAILVISGAGYFLNLMFIKPRIK